MFHTTINICKPECFPERKLAHLKITQMSGKTPTVVPFLFTMQVVSGCSWMDLKTCSDEVWFRAGNAKASVVEFLQSER
jgi:hypothetical protein